MGDSDANDSDGLKLFNSFGCSRSMHGQGGEWTKVVPGAPVEGSLAGKDVYMLGAGGKQICKRKVESGVTK